MPRERSYYLAQLCTELVQDGNDFPIVWDTVLKDHPLVEDIPQFRREDPRPLLEIKLITGERLVFDDARKKFSVK